MTARISLNLGRTGGHRPPLQSEHFLPLGKAPGAASSESPKCPTMRRSMTAPTVKAVPPLSLSWLPDLLTPYAPVDKLATRFFLSDLVVITTFEFPDLRR